ncbi:hypothetical protein Y1Q_0007857 [Alligator mississippiensis]|uniref:Uncharacterized protein n=1 Tax=Alligator mississippiensis TaxID=8496 RepID=A0A151NEL3_ALLMI|nr:hypothetical protein Y1Q_0007857 [Alligator mississippiensis]
MEVINLKLHGRGVFTSDASAGRCLKDKAKGNPAPGSGQASDMELAVTVGILLERLQEEEETKVTSIQHEGDPGEEGFLHFNRTLLYVQGLNG